VGSMGRTDTRTLATRLNFSVCVRVTSAKSAQFSDKSAWILRMIGYIDCAMCGRWITHCDKRWLRHRSEGQVPADVRPLRPREGRGLSGKNDCCSAQREVTHAAIEDPLRCPDQLACWGEVSDIEWAVRPQVPVANIPSTVNSSIDLTSQTTAIL
jgi:hypothetical protein